MTKTREKAHQLVDSMGSYQAKEQWRQWLRRNWKEDFGVPLFDTTQTEYEGIPLQVASTDQYNGKRVLKRHPSMEQRVSVEVKTCILRYAFMQNDVTPQEYLTRKIGQLDASWDKIAELSKTLDGNQEVPTTLQIGFGDTVKQVRLDAGESLDIEGILYMMYTMDDGFPIPRYIGITTFENIGGYLNQTISFADSKFARWGYGRNQHLGELSNALFDHGREPSRKYKMWVDDLFVDKTPILKEPVYFTAQVWGGNLKDAEELLVRIASKAYPDQLLNIQFRDKDMKLSQFEK